MLQRRQTQSIEISVDLTGLSNSINSRLTSFTADVGNQYACTRRFELARGMFCAHPISFTFERDNVEFATSIHTDTTIAVGRTTSPSESG